MLRDHLPDRDMSNSIAALIMFKGGDQRSETQFIDAHGAGQRMFFKLSDKLFAARDNARLWPTKQLIAAERYQIEASPQTILRGWLVIQSELGSIQERAATQIINRVNAALMRYKSPSRVVPAARQSQSV